MSEFFCFHLMKKTTNTHTISRGEQDPPAFVANKAFCQFEVPQVFLSVYHDFLSQHPNDEVDTARFCVQGLQLNNWVMMSMLESEKVNMLEMSNIRRYVYDYLHFALLSSLLEAIARNYYEAKKRGKSRTGEFKRETIFDV